MLSKVNARMVQVAPELQGSRANGGTSHCSEHLSNAQLLMRTEAMSISPGPE